jgi:desulfoferrodoxin-like iron-binding protein
MPTEKGEVYVCVKCGAEVLVTAEGFGYLVCCDEAMKKK